MRTIKAAGIDSQPRQPLRDVVVQFAGKPGALGLLCLEQLPGELGDPPLLEDRRQNGDGQRYRNETGQCARQEVPFVPLPGGRFAKPHDAAGRQMILVDVPVAQLAPVEHHGG